jgi:hypothetical protein
MASATIIGVSRRKSSRASEEASFTRSSMPHQPDTAISATSSPAAMRFMTTTCQRSARAGRERMIYTRPGPSQVPASGAEPAIARVKGRSPVMHRDRCWNRARSPKARSVCPADLFARSGAIHNWSIVVPAGRSRTSARAREKTSTHGPARVGVSAGGRSLSRRRVRLTGPCEALPFDAAPCPAPSGAPGRRARERVCAEAGDQVDLASGPLSAPAEGHDTDRRDKPMIAMITVRLSSRGTGRI